MNPIDGIQSGDLLARVAPADDTCPWCGCAETWFDRTISYLPDGTEDGMKTRCIKCGRATDDLPQEDNA